METVSFTAMADGTKEDYELLDRLADDYLRTLPDRLLEALEGLRSSLAGYQVTRYEHSLQSATRAYDDGRDEEYVVAALLHDIGDELAPLTHGEFMGAVLRPYCRPEVVWIVRHHGVFQSYYYAHHLGGDRLLRDRLKDHPWYAVCVRFCEWDQASFDPDYATRPLDYFEPLLRRIFLRSTSDHSIDSSAI